VIESKNHAFAGRFGMSVRFLLQQSTLFLAFFTLPASHRVIAAGGAFPLHSAAYR
jgi:hypothetical protein